MVIESLSIKPMLKNQLGFVPFVVIILFAVIVGATGIIVKNGILVGPQPTPDKGFEGSVSAKLKAKSSNNTVSTTPIPTFTSVKTTPTPIPNSNSSNSTNTSSSNNSNNTQTVSTSTPTPSPTSTSTPTPTAAPLKTYTWNGNHINTTTKCNTGDSTFDIEVSGDVTTTSYSDGVWTTLTGNGQTIIVSYDQGNYPSSIHIAYNFNDQVSSIRSGSISLQTSGSTTYGYEIKAYSAPFTNGTPSLSNQIGNVSFATDCK